MTDPDDLPSPFDAATVAAVAAVHGVDPARLASLASAHQAAVRAYASASGWVYELRRAYPRDALVARRPEAFYLAVEPTVWPEFERAIGVDDGDGVEEGDGKGHGDGTEEGDGAEEGDGGDDDGRSAHDAGDEAAALRALHDRVLRAAVDRPADDRESMVVVR